MAAPLNLNQHKAKVLLLTCLSLTVGIALAAWLPVYFDQRVFFIAAWLMLPAALWFWPRRAAAVWLMLAALLFGYWRYQLTTQSSERDLVFYQNKDIVLSGRVKAEPEVGESSLKLTVAAATVDGRPVAGDFLMFAPLSDGYLYGDELTADCWLEPPLPAAARYYRRLGLAGICQYTQLKLTARGRGAWVYQQIINLRRWASGLVKGNLPYPEADLGAAMTLGAANKLNPDLKTAFSQSGLTHLVAISGLNVSLLVGLLFGGALALGLSRKMSLLLALAAVSGYVLLVGAPASAVRAGIMGVLFLLAAWLGRLNKLINALALAAVVSLLANPFLLRDDIGWQLSFLALLGIIYLYPLLRLWLTSAWRPLDLALDGLALTFAAQAATWPVIAANFGQVSLVAPLANLAAVWTTPFILVAIFAALFLSALWSWWLWWLPALVWLKYLSGVAVMASRWPLASVSVEHFNSWPLIIYYLALTAAVGIYFLLVKKKKPQALSR